MDKISAIKGIVNWLHVFSLHLSDEVALFIGSQVMLETGYLTSDVYKINHNLFGMRMPKKRITTSLYENLSHAAYPDLVSSFHDYLLWLVMNGFTQADMQSLGLFTVKLRKSNFNPSEKYVDTIMKIYNTYKDEIITSKP